MPARDPKIRARFIAATCFAFFLVGGIGRFALAAPLTAWDQQLLEAVAGGRTPLATTMMRALSTIGAGTVAIPIGLVIAWVLYRRRERQAALCYIVTTLSGWGLNLALKAAFRRPRPSVLPHLDVAGGFSYPSGHAMLAPLVFAFGAILLARGRPRPVAAVWWAAGGTLALAIAASRVYLAVHYPSDVFAALLAGAGWAALGVAVYSPLDPHPSP